MAIEGLTTTLAGQLIRPDPAPQPLVGLVGFPPASLGTVLSQSALLQKRIPAVFTAPILDRLNGPDQFMARTVTAQAGHITNSPDFLDRAPQQSGNCRIAEASLSEFLDN